MIVIFFILFLIYCINFESNSNELQEKTQLSGSNTIETKGSNLQEWLRIWGTGIEGYDVVVDKYNSCYLAGSTSSDAFLMKYDSEGNQIWYRTWGGSGNEEGNSVVLDNKSEYLYFVGETDSFSAGNSDGFLVKYDLDGNQVWNRTWGRYLDDAGFRIAVDDLGNCYVAGIIDTHDDFSGDAFLIKFDSGGTPLWNQTLGGPTYDVAADVAIDSGNYCYLGCTFGSIGGEFNLTLDIFIAKYTTGGTQVWNRTWDGGGSWENCEGIVIDQMNNFYILAYWDCLLLKFDSDGNQLWYRIWNDRCVGTDIAIDNDNNCYITGFGDVDDYYKTYFCAFIAKFNSEGIELGHRFFYEEGMYWGDGIGVDNYNNYYIAGSNSFQYIPGAFLFKGNILYPSQVSGFEWLFLLIIGEIVGMVIIELYCRKKGLKD